MLGSIQVFRSYSFMRSSIIFAKLVSPRLGARLALPARAPLFFYGLAYLLVLSALVWVWAKFPQMLYLYRDGEYNLWLSLETARWSAPFDLTSINPLQGMTSMLITINPYFNPGQWVFFTDLPQGIKILSSYLIYAMEVQLSTLFLGRALGFSCLYAFIASIAICFFLFPPFNFFFGLGGWFAVNPMYAHTLTLSNLAFIVCLKLGVASDPIRLRRMCKNLLGVGLLVLLIFALLIAAPFYNAGMLLGTALVLSCLTFCSQTREQFYWRVFAGLAVLAAFYTLGLPAFYQSAKIYSARFSENKDLLTLNWPSMTALFNQETFSKAWNTLCVFGVHCDAYPGWPLSLSTAWINTAIIAGGFTASRTLSPPASRMGLFLALGWISLLLVCAGMALGTALFGIAFFDKLIQPSWVFLMSYSLCAIYSLYFFYLPIKFLLKRARFRPQALSLSLLALVLAFAVSVWLMHAFRSLPVQMPKLKPGVTESKTAVMLEERHPVTAFIQLMRGEIALQPGKRFRGLVATIYGTGEGSLRKALKTSQPASVVDNGQFEGFLAAAAQSGSSHDLLDLWAWNIPTLSEYGQGLSRPLMFYIKKFLSAPEDIIESHFAFPHQPNLDILRTLGVRYVIIDAPLADRSATLRRQLNAGTQAKLFLYELSTPNLGTYSPTQLQVLHDVDEFVRKIREKPERLEREAFIEVPINVDLTPATDAKLVFLKGGIQLTARSKGTSALLLPLQFSHCYRPLGASAAKVKILRANLIHTLVIFKGALNLQLTWNYHWTQSTCRWQDAVEMKNFFEVPSRLSS